MNLFDPKNKLCPRDYVKILTRRRWSFFLPIIIVIPLGLFKIATTKSSYESSCLIEVESSSLMAGGLKRVVPGVATERNDDVGLENRIMNSTTLGKVIERLRLREDKGVRARAAQQQVASPHLTIDEIVDQFLIERLKKAIQIKVYYRGLMKIQATADTPNAAYQLVKMLIDLFIEESILLDERRIQEMLSFSTDQAAIYRRKLEDAERRLQQFEKDQIAKQVGERTLTPESIARIQEAILATEASIKERREYLKTVDTRIREGGFVYDLPSLPSVSRLEEDIATRVNQMADLMASYSSNSARVIKINRTVNEQRDRISREFSEYYAGKGRNFSPVEQELFANKSVTFIDLRILDQKARALDGIVSRFQRSASHGPDKKLAIDKLKEEVRLTRSIYNMFLQQSQGTQIEDSIQRADAATRFHILEPPVKAIEPVNASVRVVFLMTIVLGFGLGGGVVIGSEFLDKSIRTVDEAEEYFSVPVLCVMPHVDNPPERIGMKALGLASAIFLVLAVAGVLYKLRTVIATELLQ